MTINLDFLLVWNGRDESVDVGRVIVQMGGGDGV